jgi:glyoxylase-like metal-dependent hydrolase (beta-lactamase superfamily II)
MTASFCGARTPTILRHARPELERHCAFDVYISRSFPSGGAFMITRRRFVASAASAIGALAARAGTEPSPSVTLTPLASNVWRHTSWSVFPDGTRFPSNGLVVRGRRRVLIIDTTWMPQDMETLLARVGEVAGELPRLLVPTHAHGDRMSGLGIARANGVRTMAFDLSQQDAPSRDLPLADQTWKSATKRFDLGGMHVEFFHPGCAHTRDNIVGFVEEAEILFGGCQLRAMSDTSVGALGDACLDEWPKSLDRVVRRYAHRTRIAVPGHFEHGGPELLAHTRTLVEAAIARRSKG